MTVLRQFPSLLLLAVANSIMFTTNVVPYNIKQTTISLRQKKSLQKRKCHDRCDHIPWIRETAGKRNVLNPSYASKIVDAEFVKLNDNDNQDDGRKQDDQSLYDKQLKNKIKVKSTASKTLLELSLESDQEFMTSRIPFVDTTVDTTPINSDGTQQSASKNNYIDIKLAFMVSLDNTQYGIGVPFDTAVAITYEKADGTIEYISPDNINDNDMIELIAIMATQVQENIGSDIQLQHTPRILTIRGPIEKYTKDWETTLLPKPINATQLLESLRSTSDDTNDDGDVGLDFFHKFMKEELGQEEYDKTMNEDISIDDMDDEIKEMLKLFEVPGKQRSGGGSNSESTEIEEMKDLLDTLLTPEQDYEMAKQQFGVQNMFEQDGYAALKLISYLFANGVSYSLVQLLQPYIIVGKYVLDMNDEDVNSNGENDANNEDIVGHFELLLPEEEQLLIPRLEEICQEDLQKANLQFRSISKS